MSGKRHRRSLTEEERKLWRRVGRTVTPLRDRDVAMPDQENSGREFLDAMDAAGSPAGPPARERKSPLALRQAPPPPPPKPSRGTGIDRPTTRKLAKGRISIDARMDLHEMTQDVAYDRLYAFLADQRSRGARHVLVVTGKGRSPGSEGILKRMVPVWLNSARFAELVSGYTQASRHHGGEGAIYVRLRRLSHSDGSLRP